MLTIPDILNQENIPFKTHGKNIGKDWIGLRCVNCGDNRNHFGINLKTGHCHCWLCGFSGSFRHFLIRSGIPGRFLDDLLKKVPISASQGHVTNYQPDALPKILQDFVSPIRQEYRDYFEMRGFDPDFIQRKYFVMSPENNIGKYKFRAIIPIVMEGNFVGFFGRDITGRAHLRYLHSDDSVNLIPRKEWVFNIDSVKNNKTSVIVEGALDAMKLGEGALAVLSTSYSKQQLNRIRMLGLRKIFVMFDNEPRATEKAYRMANSIAPFCDVEVITGTEWSDPGEMTEIQVRNFRRDIF